MASIGTHFELQHVFEANGPVQLEDGCFDRIKAAMPTQQPTAAGDSGGQKKPDEATTTADQDCGVGFSISILPFQSPF